MNAIFKKIFSGGPFSAVRPYLGDTDRKFRPDEEKVEEPKDGFERSQPEDAPPGDSAPPSESLRKGGARSAAQAALRAFPQVVHLLVDPAQDWAESLAREVGLPLISLKEGSVESLEAELAKPEYDNGFILEGFPSDADSARKLDGLLGNVLPESRRVLGWDLTHQTHQEVVDHYVDQDLLWMVPEPQDPNSAQEVKQSLLSCLTGLPALQ